MLTSAGRCRPAVANRDETKNNNVVASNWKGKVQKKYFVI